MALCDANRFYRKNNSSFIGYCIRTVYALCTHCALLIGITVYALCVYCVLLMCTLCVILANTLVHPLALSSRTQGVLELLLLPMCVVDYVYGSCSSLFVALCRLMAAHSEFIVEYTKNCVIPNAIYSAKLVTASTRLLYITIR